MIELESTHFHTRIIWNINIYYNFAYFYIPR